VRPREDLACVRLDLTALDHGCGCPSRPATRWSCARSRY